MFDAEYKQLLKSFHLEQKTYKCIADDWKVKQEEWYHALISIEDLPATLEIPDLKVYSWCRCKVVASDKSEDHLHLLGLVHFPKIKRKSWRRQANWKGVKLSSRKNTFKNSHCLDRAVGVLRYLAWDQWKPKTRRDEDGLVTLPHTHYARQPISDYHRHSRGKTCEKVRSGISRLLSKDIDFSKKENWTWLNFHDAKTCKCAKADIGRKKSEDANKKRRAFCKTTKE